MRSILLMSDDIYGFTDHDEYTRYLQDLICHIADKYKFARYGSFETIPAKDVMKNDVLILNDPIRVVFVDHKLIHSSEKEVTLEFTEIRAWRTSVTYSTGDTVQVCTDHTSFNPER